MGDTYVECMVAKKKNPFAAVIRTLVYALAAAGIISGLLLGSVIGFIAGAAFIAVAYFALPNLEIEYEYLYINKEMSIDKIMSKERRKNILNLDLGKMVLMCPLNSHELDSYKARGLAIRDFTSREADIRPFVIVCHDDQKNEDMLISIEPNEEMLRAIKQAFPRKVVEY